MSELDRIYRGVRRAATKLPPESTAASAAGSQNGRVTEDPSVPVVEIEVLTARELCALPDPDRSDELLGPLVVRGCRTIIGGHTGEGKTTFTALAVAAIVKRQSLLEWEGSGGSALVLDLEQGLRTVKRVLREAGLEESDDVDYARIPDGLALDKSVHDIVAVLDVLERKPYDVVVLDPHYKAHRGEANAERETVDLMRQLDAWRAEFGFALMLPVHYRKPQNGTTGPPTIHDLFGSSALVRGAEVIVGLQRLDPGYARLHFFKDREGELPVGEAWGLLFDRQEGFRRDPADTAPPRDLEAEIEAFLDEYPRSTTNAVTKGIGAGKERVSTVLKESKRFSHEKGPGNAHLWVVSRAENHSDHVGTAEGDRVVSGHLVPPKGVGAETTDTPGGSDETETTEELDWR